MLQYTLEMNVLEYLLQLERLQEKHPLLEEMEELASRRRFPILNPLSARFLALLSASSKSRTVLEIGSGFGYSALWIALYNPFLKEIILTDTDEENMGLAKDFFERAGLINRAKFMVGDGVKVLESLEEVDFIFNDAHKVQYPVIFKLARERLPLGGTLVSDNALWHGRVMDNRFLDDNTESIREFNILSYADDDFITSLIPLGDGLMVSVRIR